MKRSIFILLAASALAALSCTKEVNDRTAPEKEQVTMSFNATVGTSTKVELGAATAEGYGVLWSLDDAITVAAHDASVQDGSYTNGSEFTTDITQATASAVFEGTVDAGDAYYAVYPYNSNTRWYHQYKDFSVPFKATQTANGLKNGILVAKAEDGNLDFKHVTGFVKFTIPDTYTDIKEVRFSGNNSEVLASQYYRIYPDNMNDNETNQSTYTELILVPSSGDVFTPGTYYFTSLPADLTKGITLTFVNSEGNEAVKSTDENKPAEIQVGDILNLGEITGLSFEAPVSVSEYEYTFEGKQFSGNGDLKLGDLTWTLAGDGNYWGYDSNNSNKGQQFGSGNQPYKTMTLSTSGFSAPVNKIKINTSGASSINGSFTVTVNGVTYGTSTTLTTTATEYTFMPSDEAQTGEIKFSYSQTSSKAIYIKSISINKD